MALRPYQQKAVEEALHALARSGSAVLQMPTGAGKTKAATEIIANHGGIVWFVCHRREIERQAARAFREAGIEFGIVSPRAKPDYSKRVQIVSVGTLARRVADLPAPSLVVWDECHHVAAKSWAGIREALTDALHLGLTATPERFDGKGLREWFAELIPGPSIPDLIPEFLSAYSYFAPSSPDLTAARMQAGDYAKGDAAKIMNTPVLIGDAFREYREKADGKRALAFCVTREASKALVERFQAEGVPAVHIDANTKDDEREAAVEDLVAGRIKLISNVEVFTEGVDIPEIDAVILLRPTKSPTLFFQMVGRVLRKAEGKAGAVILDHAGLVEDHGRLNDPWTWSIDGGAAKARRKASAGFRKCPKCKFCPQEREPVCSACGYEYPAGREIGEFDGVLREIRGEIPEGFVSRAAFERLHGVSNRTVISWIERGMPHSQFGVPLEDANRWVATNVDFASIRASASAHAPPPGYTNLRGFARRHGFSSEHFTKKAIGMGLPNQCGLVPILEGDDWVAANREFVDRSLASSIQKQKQSDRLSLAEFAKMVGVKRATLGLWAKTCGFPYDPRRGVDAREGMRWVESNSGKVQGLDKPDGAESMNEFAKRHNRAAGTIKNWIGLGLPFDGKYVPSVGGDEWVSKNSALIWSRDRRAAWSKPPGHSNISDFARILDVTRHKVRHNLIESGLPYDHKLGIPIQAALEWVRDNRPDIVIPPEAWPTADNDNAAATKAA